MTLPNQPAGVTSRLLAYSRRVFTNRPLRMDLVEAIGFDMDYTLCRYLPGLEVLATELAIAHLVKRGYPTSVRNLVYDPRWGIRGLVVDTEMGNVVKMNAHRHVTRALHGKTMLHDEERRRIYSSDPPRLSAERWAVMDTVFSTPESFLYAHMVDILETESGKALGQHETRRLYADIRYCIDLVHRDDSLKSVVREAPDRYIERDLLLPHTLHRLRSAGKKLFVLTNSDMSYTEAVMNHLLEGTLSGYKDWRDFFDLVWVDARKPGFFERQSEPFCLDTDVYEGGSRVFLEKILGVGGDKVAYVGDHIYGDVLKTKTTTGWRTVLVVPELEDELPAIETELSALAQRSELETERFELEAALASAELSLQAVRRAERHAEHGANSADGAEKSSAEKSNGIDEVADRIEAALVAGVEVGRDLVAERERLRAFVHELRERVQANVELVRTLTARIEQHFNPRWGQVLKERQMHSLFGAQMKSYACLYSSRVSNFAAYSPSQYFQPPRDLLPHERLLGLGGDLPFALASESSRRATNGIESARESASRA